MKIAEAGARSEEKKIENELREWERNCGSSVKCW
jgi:hypothetical protein